MGDIIDLARQNAREILNGGFSTELTITPAGGSSFIINGTTAVHSQGFDADGLPVIGPNSHCTFSELDITDLGIVTRDTNNDLNVKGWEVSFTDQFGTYNCKIKEQRPDRGLGIIVAILAPISV